MACGRKLIAATIFDKLSADTTLLRLVRWALAVTVAAAPLYVVRWHIGPLPTTLLEAMILVTCGLYALQLLRQRSPLPSRTSYEIPIALLLVAGVIGIVVSSDHRGALGIFRAYLVEPVLLYYVVVAVIDFETILVPLLATWAAGAAVFAMIELGTFARALGGGHINPGDVPAAFNINPNSVSLFIDPLLGVAAGYALFARGRLRGLAFALTALLAAADLTTLSRGGLLAIGVLFLIALATTQSWRRQLALLAMAAIAVLAIFNLPLIGPRVTGAANPELGTFVGRGRIWAATARMLRDHPVFGAGLGSYERTMAPYIAVDRNLVPEPYAHNILLSTWSELGVLGMLAF